MRPSLDRTFLDMALVASRRGSCEKRQVGCVVTDAENKVIATGWNGRPKAMGNCHETPCGQRGCQGIHAEVNALLQAGGLATTCYVTHAPCWHCIKTIANSGVTRVVYLDDSTMEDRTFFLAVASSIKLEHYKEPT